MICLRHLERAPVKVSQQIHRDGVPLGTLGMGGHLLTPDVVKSTATPDVWWFSTKIGDIHGHSMCPRLFAPVFTYIKANFSWVKPHAWWLNHVKATILDSWISWIPRFDGFWWWNPNVWGFKLHQLGTKTPWPRLNTWRIQADFSLLSVRAPSHGAFPLALLLWYVSYIMLLRNVDAYVLYMCCLLLLLDTKVIECPRPLCLGLVVST